MAETFKLPCSSYEELIKLFQAYAGPVKIYAQNYLQARLSEVNRQ